MSSPVPSTSKHHSESGASPAGLRALYRGLLGCVVLSAVACTHQDSALVERGTPKSRSLGRWIDDYVNTLEADKPPAQRLSGFVGVARHGQWEVQRGYRVDESQPPDADTRFRIGSISKQFTAVAILKLCSQGRLELSDPVGKYVPGLSAAVAAVQLEHLLSQRSGIADFTDNEALMSRWMELHRVDEVLRAFADVPLRAQPGAVFEYSNSNYFLLGLVAQAVTGNLDGYLQDHVFEPAGMTRSSTLTAPALPNTLTGHTADASGNRITTPQDDPLLVLGGGMLFSTANDLVAWDRALEQHKVLSAPLQTELLTPHVDAVPAWLKQEVPSFQGYAFGVNVFCTHERQVHSHNGAVAGFTSYFARIPEQGWVIVVLSDSDGFLAPDLGKPLVDMLLTSTPTDVKTHVTQPCPVHQQPVSIE